MFEEYGKVTKNADLTNYNTYKIKCICDYLIIVESIVKLTNLINYLENNHYKYKVIGNGSNLILPDHYKGVIIKLSFNEINFDKEEVTVGASVMINYLASLCLKKGLSGLEWASGIPGTVGACVYNNAGAYLDETNNHLLEIEVLENNKVKIINAKNIESAYRTTSLKKRNLIILKVKLKLIKGNIEEMEKLTKERFQKRISTQPLEYPSAGSVFRNPEGTFAGKLIEELGLKGYMIGGAMISEKHANFIINKDNATGKDIIELINLVKQKVKEKYNIDLILEQEIVD